MGLYFFNLIVLLISKGSYLGLLPTSPRSPLLPSEFTMRLFITLVIVIFLSACGDLDLGLPLSIGSSLGPSEDERFLRQAQDVRLHMGSTLHSSKVDNINLIDVPLPLESYNRVTCLIDGVAWPHCYTSADACGAGSFPTACFSADGGLRACVRGSEALAGAEEGGHCSATTRDGMGANGGPMEVIYCGADTPPGRAVSGWVECEGEGGGGGGGGGWLTFTPQPSCIPPTKLYPPETGYNLVSPAHNAPQLYQLYQLYLFLSFRVEKNKNRVRR